MLHATRDTDNPARLYCTACFTGKYPVLSEETRLVEPVVASSL
jgi:hypothetical protein